MKIYTGVTRRGRTIEHIVHNFHAYMPRLSKSKARALKKRERREARFSVNREAA